MLTVLERGKFGGRRTVAHWEFDLQKGHSLILRYGFAAVCVVFALGLALPMRYLEVRAAEPPLFSLAVAGVWFAGSGPGVLAIVLSALCFDYFFTEPLTGHPVVNESGEVAEFVGTNLDVTERKRAEEERERLRHLEADLAHMNRVSMLAETGRFAGSRDQVANCRGRNGCQCLLEMAKAPAA